MFKSTKEKKELVNNLDHLSLYEKHIGIKIKLGKLIVSPLREESRPSFNIYIRNGKYIFKDFGGESGDIYKFIQLLYNIDFKEAVDMLYQENVILLDVKKHFKKHKKKYTKKPISIKKEFFVDYCNKNDYSYYDISEETLSDYRCFSIKSFSFYKKDGDLAIIKSSPGKPIYTFAYNQDTFKFYNPSSLKLKHIGNTGEKDVFGKWLYDPSKPTFICAGQKDTMKQYDLFKGLFNCIAFNSESTVDIEFLKQIKEGYIVYDVDKTGRKYAEKINNLNSNLSIIDLYNFTSYVKSKAIKEKTKDIYDICTSSKEIEKLYKREIDEAVYILRNNRNHHN